VRREIRRRGCPFLTQVNPLPARIRTMETISLNGRRVPGFALGQASADTVKFAVTPAVAAVSVGVTAGLLAAVLHAPLWATLVTGSAAALVTKVGIDKAADKTA